MNACVFSNRTTEPLEAITQCPPFDWETLGSNAWVKLDTCGEAPRKVFHGAASIAVDRGEVFFFGADTHEVDYDNSVTRLHLQTLRWSKDYEPDPPDAYMVTPEGFPVTRQGRPWAMHAFDTLDYHPPSGRLLFVGYPKHAHRPKHQLQKRGVNPNRLKPATWWYDPDTKHWELLNISSPRLFAHALVWDSQMDQFIGHDGSSTFHFDPTTKSWKTYHAASMPGWHQKLVFETENGHVMSFGNHQADQDLWRYAPPEKRWEKVPVQGPPPLPANGAAMAYDTHQKALLYLANDSPSPYSNPSRKSVTFLYDSSTRSWARLKIPSPPLYGMNFLTQYDPVRGVFLHFEKESLSDEHLAVWALRWEKN